MTNEQDPNDPAEAFAKALRKEVRDITAPQIEALSAANAALLVLMVEISERLIKKGALDRTELISMATAVGKPRPGDLIELQKVRQAIADLFARGLQIGEPGPANKGGN